MKINYIGIIAAILAFSSLFLPWFTIKLWTENMSSIIDFSANLYQLTGTVEGVTKSMFLIVWFNGGAFVLMLTTFLACIVSSTFAKRRRLLFFISCALSLVAMLVFGYGLANSNFAVEEINPGYTINLFPEGSFGLSAEQAMQNSYSYSWDIGIGFWLALVTAIFALIAALMSRRFS